MARRHLINVHSSVKDKAPLVDPNDMRYGELAVNHFQGKAFISTRVSETDMELFPSIHYIEQYPFSSLAVKDLTTLSGTTKIEKVEAGDKTFDDSLSETSVNAVQNKAITKAIFDNEKITSSALNDLNERKLDASAYTPTDLSDYYKKEETSGKTELDSALGLKANASDLTVHTADSKVHITADERTKWNGKISSAQYSSADKRINFYSGATTETPVSFIDASDFVTTQTGPSINLNDYYKKTETSSKTEISDALNLKANSTDLTSHTSNSTIHITGDERTKWNNAVTSSHTHSNKDVLDKITAIDTELKTDSSNLVVNSAITKTIQDNEEAISSSLNDLNKRKLDASAYTPTDLSDYYKKEETSSKTEISDALNLKANATALTAHTADSKVHITDAERTKWNGKFSNVQYDSNQKRINFYSGATTEAAVAYINANDFIQQATGSIDLSHYYMKDETSGKAEISDALVLKANESDLTSHTGDKTVHITADERTNWNNAATNSHTHANKAVLDKITAIDTELKTDSNNLVVNSAITMAIQDNEEVISASLNDLNKRKLDASAYTPTDLSNYYKKTETSSKTELDAALKLKANTSDLSNYYKKTETSGSTQLTTAFNSKANTDDLATKANATDLTTHTGNSDIHTSATEKAKWDAAAKKVETIDTELKTDSSNLVVNSAITKTIQDNEEAISASLNDLNKRKLDASAYTPADLSGYYKRTETSGKAEISDALVLKANESDLTSHTGDKTVHITADERTKWDNAVTSSHTHANKDVLDTITAIDTELKTDSNNLVVNSAITKAIQENEEAISTALNDLNKRLKIIEAKLGL